MIASGVAVIGNAAGCPCDMQGPCYRVVLVLDNSVRRIGIPASWGRGHEVKLSTHSTVDDVLQHLVFQLLVVESNIARDWVVLALSF